MSYSHLLRRYQFQPKPDVVSVSVTSEGRMVDKSYVVTSDSLLSASFSVIADSVVVTPASSGASLRSVTVNERLLESAENGDNVDRV